MLGPIADLLMLRELIEAHGKTWTRERFDVLAEAIERLTESRIRAARKLARPLFAPRAKELARRVGKALRKDAHPPAPLVEDGDPGDSDDE